MPFKLGWQSKLYLTAAIQLESPTLLLLKSSFKRESPMKTSSILYAFLLFFPLCANAQSLEALITKGILPKSPLPPIKTIPLLNRVRDGNTETSVFLSTRAPGTRTPIHKHDEAGVTCLIEGEMTLFIDHRTPATTKAPGCYFMPSDVRMIGMNTGHSNAVFYDFFEVTPGHPNWTLHDKSAPNGAEHQFGN